jgi:outer membrane lipoprotein LolB
LIARFRIPFALVLALPLLFSACSTAVVREADQGERRQLYFEREAALAGIDDWALDGRLAVSDGEDGGSGKLRWRQSAAETEMDFHGALGRGAWRLQANRNGAMLELADGRVFREPTVNGLASSQLGWEIPVDALSWWVRGLAAPQEGVALRSAEALRIEPDEAGLPRLLRQHGWTVEYGRYRLVGNVNLPVKLTARRDGHSVKLVVRQWELPASQGFDD